MNTILFLAANPKDTDQLGLDVEFRSIDEKLRLAEFRDMFDLRTQWAVRVTDLQGALLRYKPHIVHFSGHGSPTSEIILADNTGTSQRVSPEALRSLFSTLRDKIRCVVLNACYTEPQARAIAEHIECVVGMSSSISDSAAIAFASAFYQAIGYGRNIKTAFELGCGEIDLEGIPERDTPKLLCDNSKPEQVIFVGTTQTTRSAPTVASLTGVRTQVLELALKYARFRNEMPPGDTRTRKMEDVFTDMRILVHNSHPLLKDLANSSIVGERLAAIAILQVKPDLLMHLAQPEANFLTWIASRVAEEKPFVGYHAAKTLLAAAHYPDFPGSKGELHKAIETALETLGARRNTDRYLNLLQAREVLQGP